MDTPEANDPQEYYIPTAEWCPESGFVGNDNGPMQDTQGNIDPTVNSTTNKKKGNIDPTVNSTTGNKKSTSNRKKLGELSKKLFVNYDEVEKRSGVYEAVGKVPGIDLTNQLLISDRLVENPKKMDLFFSLPDDARARMIRLMLDGKM
ncbi:hypothetical protein Salat_1877100 [Sesamum alatum]|uniref:Uncharacterized protein n=1 Tax=Sesamum alatum TaxID=300844 RepID=A0AAE2CI35_9LAMI|nr:hypothetical protein Salat_1877100 [Sesamum alatum]